MMTRCVRPRAGAGVAARAADDPLHAGEPARASAGRLAERRRASIAVSAAIARDLVARAPELPADRVEHDPQPGGRRDARCRDARPPRTRGARRSPRPYALYVGKLAPNKGARHLVPAVDRGAARLAARRRRRRPGSRRARARGARRRARRPLHRLAAARARRSRWLAHAALLVFPSHGPESLSRVLLEAGGARRARSPRWTRAARATSSCRATPACCRRRQRGSPRDVARLVADPALARTPRRAPRAPTSTRHVRRRRPSSRASSALYDALIAERREPCADSRPLRVALLARSVHPLHGVRRPRAARLRPRSITWRGAAVDVTLITRPPTTPGALGAEATCRRCRRRRAGADRAAYRALRDVPRRRAARARR